MMRFEKRAHHNGIKSGAWFSFMESRASLFIWHNELLGFGEGSSKLWIQGPGEGEKESIQLCQKVFWHQ
ncbi:hypothetical protein [Angelakisella massiliensis]|uniref:hypothetical protein n=1 Tax=Angelakisella massiliensis TaxID=1871018 RepID=UPI00111407C6|nr:hypothetical protein [Angelakisella massiliensis]